MGRHFVDLADAVGMITDKKLKVQRWKIQSHSECHSRLRLHITFVVSPSSILPAEAAFLQNKHALSLACKRWFICLLAVCLLVMCLQGSYPSEDISPPTCLSGRGGLQGTVLYWYSIHISNVVIAVAIPTSDILPPTSPIHPSFYFLVLYCTVLYLQC